MQRSVPKADGKPKQKPKPKPKQQEANKGKSGKIEREKKMASVWRWADLLAIVFFATHLPISLLIDGQALIDDANAHLVPSACKTALEYWITFSGDTLMRDRPLWFRSLVAAELSLQGTRSARARMRDCHDYMGQSTCESKRDSCGTYIGSSGAPLPLTKPSSHCRNNSRN